MELAPLGRLLVIAGAAIVAVGLALVLGDRLPFLGRLPGDVTLRGDRWTLYVPIATSIVISLALTLAFLVFQAITRR